MEKLVLIALSLMVCSIMFGQTVNDLRPTVTMKEYVDMQSELNSKMMQKVIDIQIQNINDNVVRANVAMEKRLDSINEFRGQLKDQQGTFVTWPALFGLIVGISGFIFGYANFKKNQESGRGSPGKNIQSGDTVEVKK